MPSRYKALYDDQCEVCQAFVSWIRLLDRQNLVDCLPIEPGRLAELHPGLNLVACLRELHVILPDGSLAAGWDGVAALARLFPETWWIGALGGRAPFRWLGRALYRFVAANRYALSKCRGGACRVARPQQVRRQASLGVFWSCYILGMLVRLPLIAGVGLRDLGRRCSGYAHVRGRRVDLLSGKLRLLFLGGFPTAVVPLLFGEHFWAVLYDGMAVDPGSPRMRRSLARHLRGLPAGTVRAVVATHHHEEHVGNLNWLAERAGVPLWVGAYTAKILQAPLRLPRVRSMIIGQPLCLHPPFEILGEQLKTPSGSLLVFPAPGHCDDHVVLYDPKQKLLLAGDAFMGAYFSAPNPDVDSRAWIETLERLLELDVEILVEGHGQLHTLRPDIPDIPGIVIRQHPRVQLEGKLAFLRWLRDQVDAGMSEGLPLRAIEATCFPWSHSVSWESYWNDEMMRLLSSGHWSRTELVRSFTRNPLSRAVFPDVYQVRLYCGAAGSPPSVRKDT
jgi:glyoxylase-like metal-dependent hydrolase (beta-lactamase superfamily II)/predicted DCC family thiol-disulfide oxidoreductase YuxK